MKLRYNQLYANPHTCCTFQFGLHSEIGDIGDVDILKCTTGAITVRWGNGGDYKFYSFEALAKKSSCEDFCSSTDTVAVKAWRLLNEESKYKYRELP